MLRRPALLCTVLLVLLAPSLGATWSIVLVDTQTGGSSPTCGAGGSAGTWALPST